MARLPRFYLADHPQHLIIRGNNQGEIFRTDADYLFYLDVLTRACLKHKCSLHAYVLMPNHVHLLLTPHREQSVGKVVQMLGRYYVQYFNQSYQRKGTLWEGRYKATLVDSKHFLLACSQYIEFNPVRNHLADRPEQYIWSSYGHNAMGGPNALITPHQEYLKLGDTESACQAAYRDRCQTPLPEKMINSIRESTNKAWVLGDDDYKREISKIVNRRVSPKPKGGDRRSQKYKSQRMASQLQANAYQMNPYAHAGNG